MNDTPATVAGHQDELTSMNGPPAGPAPDRLAGDLTSVVYQHELARAWRMVPVVSIRI